MESQPQNLEFRKNPENFHPCIYLGVTAHLWIIYSPHYEAFHLGLHCLPKYPFRSFHIYKGKHICEISLTVHLCMSSLGRYLGKTLINLHVYAGSS